MDSPLGTVIRIIDYFLYFAVAAIFITYVVMIYNNLVRLKHNVDKAWSNIEVLLKQRHDEIPKLVEVCKQFMSYEQETMNQIIQTRSDVYAALEKADIHRLGPAETQFRIRLGALLALSEAYPELKANSNFQHLEKRISIMETSIADRRTFYNESVNRYNIRIQQVPDIILANLLRFRQQELLEFK